MIKLFAGIIVIVLLLSGMTLAQDDAVTILCDPTFDTQNVTIPSPFSGAYYYISTELGVFDEFRFTRITAEGATEIQAPFSQQLASSVGTPRLSPDGQTMIFLPVDSQSPLVAWNPDTNEVATLTLPESEADYLSSGYIPYNEFWRQVSWQANNQLVVNYLDEEVPRIIARTIISIHQNPFLLSRDSYAEVQFPNLPVPANNTPFNVLLSPLENFGIALSWESVMGTSPSIHLQIFDLNTQTLVFDYPPSLTSHLRGYSPLWAANEQTMFMYVGNETTNRSRHIEVDINGANFQVDPYLWDTLETTFGTSVDFFQIFDTTISESGTQIAFEITSTAQGMNYLVLYDFTTASITAICDQHQVISTNHILPFWAQDDAYFGYWDSSRVVVFDVETGDVYLFPNPEFRRFVGWVES